MVEVCCSNILINEAPPLLIACSNIFVILKEY